MKKIILFVLLMVMVAFVGCTEQQRAKKMGGTTKIVLEPGDRLVNVTWKEGGDIWILTRKAAPGESAQNYTFKESSAWGIMEGTVIIIER